MFRAPFSFNGRIRRLEYGISSILLTILICLVNIVLYDFSYDFPWLWLACCIPLWWVYFAQGAKRCHDIGHSGWWQIAPFYPLVMLFKKGDAGPNEYGSDPKQPMEANYVTEMVVDTAIIPETQHRANDGLSKADE